MFFILIKHFKNLKIFFQTLEKEILKLIKKIYILKIKTFNLFFYFLNIKFHKTS